MSIDLEQKKVFFDGNAQKCWGSTANFDFYIAEQNEILKIKNELKERGYKCIPILNKLEKIHGI